jgi:hypothetical protein
MIELTTGVVFLMSSLYGAGQHGYIETNATSIPKENVARTEVVEKSSSNSKEQKEMEAYLRKEYADTPILVEVARCESEFRQFNKDGSVVRGIVNNRDVGVMQINEKYHADTADKMNIDIHTTEGNVAYAKYLYSKYGTSPWKASSPCWSKVELARNN